MTDLSMESQIPAEVAAQPHIDPEVIIFSGASVVVHCAEVVNNEKGYYVRPVDTGNRLHALQSGDTVRAITNDEESMLLQEADTLVLVLGSRHTKLGRTEGHDRLDAEKTVLHPAGEELPGGPMQIWELGGVIRGNKDIVLWGERAEKEAGLARQLTRVALPYAELQASPVARAYNRAVRD